MHYEINKKSLNDENKWSENIKASFNNHGIAWGALYMCAARRCCPQACNCPC